MTKPTNVATIEWRWILANLSIWLCIIAGYTQGFELWLLLVATVGRGTAEIAPILVSLALGCSGAVFAWRYWRRISWILVAASFVVFAAGLIFADPEFPAKRIHVPQYFLLTIVIYWSLRRKIGEGKPVWMAVIFAMMLGGVDEIAQGALPRRTFGLTDLLTNSIGALSAGLLIRGMMGRTETLPSPTALIMSNVAVGIGYILLLLGINAHKGIAFPIWLYLPALASLPLLVVEAKRNPVYQGKSLILGTMGAICMLSVVLVYGIDAFNLDFQ